MLYVVRLVLLLIWTLCLIIGFGMFVTLIVNLDALMPGGRPIIRQAPTAQFLVTIVMIGGGCVLLMSILFPYIKDPTRFNLPYSPPQPTLREYPFCVQFCRHLRSRSYMHEGAIQFRDEEFLLEGLVEPRGWVRVSFLVVKCILLPILLLPVIGLLLKLVLGWLELRTATTQHIQRPYTDIREIQVHGCRVSLVIAGTQPERITFYVANADGERLYHELFRHRPSSLAGWSPAGEIG